jgi:hypothetical protein
MKVLNISNSLKLGPYKNDEPIYVFLQYYVDPVRARHREIESCLKLNSENPVIDKVILLNERMYKHKDLGGLNSTKVQQINISKRLMYSDVFHYVNENKLKGYIIIANSDIFFDETLEKIKYSTLHTDRQMMALLRYEYDPTNKYNSKLFGPRYDSQDTWIFHTNHFIEPREEKLFAFNLGKPGCDNKLVYLMNVLNIEVVNDPATIKTYHYHKSNIRNYTAKEVLPLPWAVVVPANTQTSQIQDALGLRLATYEQIRFSDNTLLYDYVSAKLAKNEKFVIPRISTIETEFACYGRILKFSTDEKKNTLMLQMLQGRPNQVMKNNAGIKITNQGTLMTYSDKYLAAFENCDIYGGWDKQGHVYPSVKAGQDFIEESVCPTKPLFWGFAFDVFHYIKSVPWTWALRGKRILLICAFEDSIKEKIPIREKIYGIDLFPECSFITLKPPQTQGNEIAQDFDVEFNNFVQRVDTLNGQYDIALVACGGYGAPIVNYIYEKGTPAVYVGGVLQMYFGILGSRWLRERPDIVRLYLNEHWSRPKENEKPSNYAYVEGSCYW